MGQISNEVEKVKWEAGSLLNNIKNTAGDVFDSVVGKGEAGVNAVLKYDVTGIDANQVPSMQTAINTYDSTADTAQAFSGEYADGVKKFVVGVTVACGNVISMLLAFNDQLDEVKTAYEKKDETVKSDLVSQAGELESAFQRYKQDKH